MLSLTRGQIITEGLNQAGRPDLTSNARLWLNLVLEKIYSNQDVNWLVKTASNLTVGNGESFPADYRAARSAVITDTSGQSRPIEVVEDEAYWDSLVLSMQNTTGVPQYVLCDHLNREFQFLPSPKTGLSWTLRYFSSPELPDSSDAMTDSETVVWGLPYEILTDYIKHRAFEYVDDSRQGEAEKKVMMSVAEARLNNHDRRAGISRLPFGKRFRKRFK